MENATKALLITAAVLIVIVLIAISVMLLNSNQDVQSQAKSSSAGIQEQSNQAASSAISSMDGISKIKYTPEEFNNQICTSFMKYQRNGKYTDYTFTSGYENNTEKVISELERIKRICNKSNIQILSSYAFGSGYDTIDNTIRAIKNNSRPAYNIEYIADENGYISKINVIITMPEF